MSSKAASKAISLFLTVIIILSNVGCATMTTGSTQVIAVSTTPPDAIARVNGLQIRTPGQLTLKKGSAYIVRAEKEGYEAAQVPLERSFNSAWFLNILWGPLLLGVPLLFGTIIDFATGAAWNITPETVHLTLEPKPGVEQRKPSNPGVN